MKRGLRKRGGDKRKEDAPSARPGEDVKLAGTNRVRGMLPTEVGAIQGAL